MAERRPAGYPKLKNYKPSRFMLPTSHYDKAKADRAVKFIENLCHTKGKWAGKRFWLLPEAKTEWIRLSEKLNQMGVLTEIDRSAFAAYCQSYARWKEAQEHINSEGATYETENGMQRPNPWVAICNTEQRLMMQAASEFGLTPSARSRIMAASGVGKDDEDEMEALLGGEA